MKLFLIISIFVINVLTLSGCKYPTISESIYIGSIGIDYVDNNYIVYYYLPSSLDVGSTTSANNDGGYIGVVTAYSIEEAFNKMILENNVNINFRHISSLILSYNLLSNIDLSLLFEYIKYSYIIDINFYIFSTNVDIGNIYNLENPNNESAITSMLLDPQNKMYKYIYAEPIHFLNFCNLYLSNRVVKLPLITTNQIWEIDSKKQYGYYISGVVLTSITDTLIILDESLIYLKDNDNLTISETISVLLYDYKIKFNFSDLIKIDISFQYKFLDDSNIEQLTNYISTKVCNLINDYIKEIDFLNVSYYNNLHNINTDITKINIDINANEK